MNQKYCLFYKLNWSGCQKIKIWQMHLINYWITESSQTLFTWTFYSSHLTQYNTGHQHLCEAEGFFANDLGRKNMDWWHLFCWSFPLQEACAFWMNRLPVLLLINLQNCWSVFACPIILDNLAQVHRPLSLFCCVCIVSVCFRR